MSRCGLDEAGDWTRLLADRLPAIRVARPRGIDLEIRGLARQGRLLGRGEFSARELRVRRRIECVLDEPERRRLSDLLDAAARDFRAADEAIAACCLGMLWTA